MALNNFKPVIWSKKILRELDKKHMLVKHCSTAYSGEISGVGSKVKINSVNEPTVGPYVPNVTVITPESLKDESRMLEITEADYFAFEIDDVDGKQTTGGILSEGLRKAIVKMKNLAEVFVATKFPKAANTITEAALTSGNFFSTMMAAKERLLENDVEGEDIVLEVSPAVFTKGVLADIVFNNQDNGDMIRKGTYSQLLQMMVYVSNNLDTVRTSADIVVSKCVMRTKEAVGYAEQIMKTVKYMPDNSFSDAIKGLHVYGAKELKPKEMVFLDLTTAAESIV